VLLHISVLFLIGSTEKDYNVALLKIEINDDNNNIVFLVSHFNYINVLCNLFPCHILPAFLLGFSPVRSTCCTCCCFLFLRCNLAGNFPVGWQHSRTLTQTEAQKYRTSTNLQQTQRVFPTLCFIFACRLSNESTATRRARAS